MRSDFVRRHRQDEGDYRYLMHKAAMHLDAKEISHAFTTLQAEVLIALLHGLVKGLCLSWQASPVLFDATPEATQSRLKHSLSLTNTVWALAKQGHASPVLFGAILDVATSYSLDFNSQSMATCLWAFTTVGQASPALFDAISEVTEAAISRVTDFNSQSLANTVRVWAFVTHGQASPVLFDAITEVATSYLTSFQSQSLAYIAWAIATIATSYLMDFNFQVMVTFLWAFTTVGQALPAPFDAITEVTEAAISCVTDFKSQSLANTVRVWAFVTHGQASPVLFDAITEVVTSHLTIFQSQSLANTAWAFAIVGRASPVPSDAIKEVTTSSSIDCNSQILANTVWAFATHGQTPPTCFDAIAEVAIRYLTVFQSQRLANTAWAFATVGRASPVLFDGMLEVAKSYFTDFNSQSLANTVWARYDSRGGDESPEGCSNIKALRTHSGLLPHLAMHLMRALAHTAWACATVVQASMLLSDVIAEAATQS